MTRYLIVTDTHFGSENIRRYCGRPDNCEELMYNNLFNLSLPHDIVIHLGDIYMGREGRKTCSNLIKDIKNKTNNRTTFVLTKGNHDKETYTSYYKCGFDLVVDSFTIDAYGKNIVFSHKPAHDGVYDISIFGHFHNNPKERWESYLVERLTDKHHCISIENNNYSPVILEKYLGRI